MATQHPSPALLAPAHSAAYPMAKPGYGKRSAPDQHPRTRHDFALLPTRERYVAGFVDHLPEGAAMSVKHLAKQLPLYGQQAVSTALTALSVAGHLRRVRCAVGVGDETRWVFRTFWSRTARDNEWWNAYLAAEEARGTRSAPGAPRPDTTPPRAPAEEPPPAPQEGPCTEQAPAAPQPPKPTAVPHQRPRPQDPYAASAPDAGPVAAPYPPRPSAAAPSAPSPAYLALARLGRTDHRLALSAADCAALEAPAAQWLARGVTVDYLTTALTAGLPAHVDSPVGFVRRRLVDKAPPLLPADSAPPGGPARRILVECSDCGVPGRPEALPDGLCRPCRTAHRTEPAAPCADVPAADVPDDIRARMADLRGLLRAP
ncbi:MarR family transcriptional regulator [Streptomyces pratensis]|uniref:MarR family transcriptional regulator n=1 Tax=Streptomyces pratensis TaxID=1169025 RepID=UPI0030195BA2